MDPIDKAECPAAACMEPVETVKCPGKAVQGDPFPRFKEGGGFGGELGEGYYDNDDDDD
jgi:hypothetical protein